MATLHSPISASLPHSPNRRAVPPLAQGDRLTRSEFLERYAAMPPKIKAERIEGMVYMPAAAVSAGFHLDPDALVTDMDRQLYEAATPGVIAADNSTIARSISG